jgi:hypothetical protein
MMTFTLVIASHRVGAKRRPMTGSAKQSIFPQTSVDFFVAIAPRNDEPADLPDGQISSSADFVSVQPCLQKIFCFGRRANQTYNSRRLVPTRGALRGLHK